MKKTRKVLLGILLSLTMAVSGVAGVTAHLNPVYAEDNAPEVRIRTYTYGDALANPGGIALNGFKFAGWFADPGCTVSPDYENADPGAAIYAKYIELTDTDADDADEDEDEELIESGDTAGSETTDQSGGYGETDEAWQDDAGEYDPEYTAQEDQEYAYVNGQESADGTEQVPTENEDTVAELPSDGDSTEAVPEAEIPAGEEEENSEDAAVDVIPAEDEAAAGDENAEDTAVPEAPEVVPEAEPSLEETAGEEAEEEQAAEEEAAPEEAEAAGEEAEAAGEEAAPEEAAEADADADTAPAEDEAKDAKENDDLLKAGEKYKVTFDVLGHGEAPAAQEVESGKTAKEPEAPSEEGYDFGGWFTDKDCTAKYDFSTAVDKDITVYAKWTIKTFTVSFSTTRGTAPAAQTVNYGDKATQPSVTDTGYTCTGWSLDGTVFDFSSPVRTDLTLTANWRPNTYTIHFDPNNTAYASATGATADVSCTYDQEAALTKNGFVRNADWEFIGWNTAADRTGTAYADLAAVKNLTAEDKATVTLYAQWRFLYKMVSGAGASVSKLDTRGLTFQTNGIYALFTGIAVDGTAVAANNYTSSAANYGTYVTLKQDFIKNLSIGQHTIQFLYQDGSVSCVFYVNNSTILNPVQTGDNSKNALWMSLFAGAAVLAAGLVFLRKKYKI